MEPDTETPRSRGIPAESALEPAEDIDPEHVPDEPSEDVTPEHVPDAPVPADPGTGGPDDDEEDDA